jgi:hypothetical protein
VEAVGIEPASDRRASPDSVAITRNGFDPETSLNPSESELQDRLGTRVPNFRRANELLEHVSAPGERCAWFNLDRVGDSRFERPFSSLR